MKKDQVKKLTLNKETLRDLTAQNAGEIKGGGKNRYTKQCNHATKWLTCTCGSYSPLCFTQGCPG